MATTTKPLLAVEKQHSRLHQQGYLVNLVLSGCTSGVVEGVLMQPLELVKTR